MKIKTRRLKMEEIIRISLACAAQRAPSRTTLNTPERKISLLYCGEEASWDD